MFAAGAREARCVCVWGGGGGGSCHLSLVMGAARLQVRENEWAAAGGIGWYRGQAALPEK